MQFSSYIEVSTKGFSDMTDISGKVESIVRKSGVRSGIVTVFAVGSTASVTTIEYEKGVIEDLKAAIERLIPSDIPYKHDAAWGDGNGFSHVRAAILKPGITIPIIEGKLALGTWQQVVFIDLDNRARSRRIAVQVTGD